MSTETFVAKEAVAKMPAAAARHSTWRVVRRDLRAVLSLGYLALLVVVSLFAAQIAPYSPIEQNVAELLMPPSAAHWLGTDDLGRDVLSRLIWGAPNSLYASALAVSVAIAIGVPVGVVIGFVGGWLDEVVSRFIDALLSFPPIVLAIAVSIVNLDFIAESTGHNELLNFLLFQGLVGRRRRNNLIVGNFKLMGTRKDPDR